MPFMMIKKKESIVNSERKTAIAAGILLITGIVFGILNSVPALEYAGYLTKLSTIRGQVLVAVFFQSAMATVYVCIAAMFYPIVRKYRAGLAIGYFGFRIIGAAFLFVGIGSLLLLLSLSQAFVSAGQVNAPYFQATGELLRTGRDIMNHIGMILPWMSGSMILYYCMFKMKLVPDWLSIWGMIGSSLTIGATLLIMLDFIDMFTPAYLMMNMPSALFELSLAVYLIVKGFNSRAAGNHQADAISAIAFFDPVRMEHSDRGEARKRR